MAELYYVMSSAQVYGVSEEVWRSAVPATHRIVDFRMAKRWELYLIRSLDGFRICPAIHDEPLGHPVVIVELKESA